MQASFAVKRPASNQSVDEMLPYYGELHAFLKNRVACREEASDLTQQTFLKLIRWSKDGARTVEHHRGVLYRIARNLLVDRSRRRLRQGLDSREGHVGAEDEDLPANPITPARVAEAREEMAVVRQAISELPERCREVFVLSRFGHLSYGEIAERLNISRSTVEKHMIKAISACKRALD